MRLSSLPVALITFGLGVFMACASEENQNPTLTPPIHDDETGGTKHSGGTSSNGGTRNHGGNTSSNDGGMDGDSGGAGNASSNGGEPGGAGAPGSGGVGATPECPAGEGREGTAGECASSPELDTTYHIDASDAKVGFTVTFVNDSGGDIDVDQLVIRYYFSDEESSGWNLYIYDAKLDGNGDPSYVGMTGSTHATLHDLEPAVDGADAYFEITFDGGVTMHEGATGTVKFEAQPKSYDSPHQNHGNDFSFDCMNGGGELNDRVAFFSAGDLLAGCSPGDGTGAGGAGGGGAGGGN
jgi:hypothetical protein